MAGTRWDGVRTELRSVRSRKRATTIAFMTTTVPGEHESILAPVGREPAFEHAGRSRFQLDDPVTLRASVERARPGQTVVLDHEQNRRMLRLDVISVVLDEDPRQGCRVVGFDMSAQRQIVLDLLWRGPGITGLTTVVAGLVAYVLVGRGTAPITRLRRATEQISPEDLARRGPVTQDDSDVGQLAVDVNGLRGRIEAAFVQQRQFLDDAAHEPRTPDDPARQPRADGPARPRRRRGDPGDAPRRDRADEPPRGGPAAARRQRSEVAPAPGSSWHWVPPGPPGPPRRARRPPDAPSRCGPGTPARAWHRRTSNASSSASAGPGPVAPWRAPDPASRSRRPSPTATAGPWAALEPRRRGHVHPPPARVPARRGPGPGPGFPCRSPCPHRTPRQ